MFLLGGLFRKVQKGYVLFQNKTNKRWKDMSFLCLRGASFCCQGKKWWWYSAWSDAISDGFFSSNLWVSPTKLYGICCGALGSEGHHQVRFLWSFDHKDLAVFAFEENWLQPKVIGKKLSHLKKTWSPRRDNSESPSVRFHCLHWAYINSDNEPLPSKRLTGRCLVIQRMV